MDTDGSVPRTAVPPLVAIGAVLVGFVAMSAVMPLAFPAGLRLALVLSQVALVVPAALALAAYGVPLRATVGRWPLDGRTAVLAVAAGVSLWMASLGLLELQYAVWAPSAEYLELFRRLHEALRPHGPLDALLSLAAIAVLPALCEELLMRGVVLPSLLRPSRPGLAIVVSAVLFAAIHWDPYRTLFTFVLGLALGWLRVRTGSLAVCIVAHAVLNGLTFAVVPFTDDPAEGLPDPRPLLGLGLFLAGSAAMLVVLRFLPSLTGRTAAPRLGA